MKKALLALSLFLASPLIAHPGHGESSSSLLHYFSAEHLIPTLGIIAAVVVVAYIANALLKQK